MLSSGAHSFKMLGLVIIFVLSVLSVGASRRPKAVEVVAPRTQEMTTLEEWNLDDDFVPYKSDRHDLFDWRLLKEVLLKDDKNAIVSPISVKMVLALLAEGAGNQTVTQKELYAVLPDIQSPFLRREYYKKILNSLKKRSDHYELKIGTKMFVDDFIEPRARYTTIAKAHYDTEIQRLKFAEKDASVQTINQWCSDVTEGHINNIVSHDNLNSAVMVLLNAIYFDGIWRRPFSENDTIEHSFYLTPERQITSSFLQQTDKFFYYHSDQQWNAKILRLPYDGGKFSMTIVLPNSKGGLNELIRQLEGDGLKRLQWLMDEREVKVTIPKLKFDYHAQLKQSLEALGITELFTNRASLPGIARGVATGNQLKVSDIYQKAGLIVNERGTKAFAATTVILENKFGGGESLEEFNANRPFLFLIEDETTGVVLFAGKVTDPTKSS